jgi:hypothetical protein
LLGTNGDVGSVSLSPFVPSIVEARTGRATRGAA